MAQLFADVWAVSNYPAGVSGDEYAIAGPDWEVDLGIDCPRCLCPFIGVAYGSDRWALCECRSIYEIEAESVQEVRGYVRGYVNEMVEDIAGISYIVYECGHRVCQSKGTLNGDGPVPRYCRECLND